MNYEIDNPPLNKNHSYRFCAEKVAHARTKYICRTRCCYCANSDEYIQGKERYIATNRLYDHIMHYIWVYEISRARSDTLAASRQSYYFIFTFRIKDRLRQVAGRKLVGWIIKFEATTSRKIATCQDLCERYLTPQILHLDQYLSNLTV